MKMKLRGQEVKVFIQEDIYNDGVASLMVKEQNGNEWYVVGLTEDGKITRFSGLPPHLFKLNKENYAKIVKE